MGVPGRRPAVADAGPLIHLFEVGQLHLASVFPALHIPLAVWEEVLRHAPAVGGAMGGIAVQIHALNHEELRRFVTEKELGSLHRGECEALCLCHKLGVSLLLTDDLAVRDAAKRLGVLPVGSLGIVARAFDLGLLSFPDAESSLHALHEVSSLFVAPAIVDLALDALRQRAHRPSRSPDESTPRALRTSQEGTEGKGRRLRK